jgi:hypothetical protein
MVRERTGLGEDKRHTTKEQLINEARSTLQQKRLSRLRTIRGEKEVEGFQKRRDGKIRSLFCGWGKELTYLPSTSNSGVIWVN